MEMEETRQFQSRRELHVLYVGKENLNAMVQNQVVQRVRDWDMIVIMILCEESLAQNVAM